MNNCRAAHRCYAEPLFVAPATKAYREIPGCAAAGPDNDRCQVCRGAARPAGVLQSSTRHRGRTTGWPTHRIALRGTENADPGYQCTPLKHQRDAAGDWLGDSPAAQSGCSQ